MAEEDLHFAYTAATHRGPPPGRRRRRAVETYAGLDRGDAFGGEGMPNWPASDVTALERGGDERKVQ